MSDNPWLSQPSLPELPPTADEESAAEPAVWAAGAEVGDVEPLATFEVGEGAGFFVMGAHGGAGTSTLAALLDAADAGTRWPTPTTGDVRVLVAARTSAYGIARAQEKARQWASGALPGVELVGVAWVADAPGRLPRSLREQVALVSGAFPVTVSVPWEGSWRTDAAPSGAAPHQIVRALSSVPGYRKESR